MRFLVLGCCLVVMFATCALDARAQPLAGDESSSPAEPEEGVPLWLSLGIDGGLSDDTSGVGFSVALGGSFDAFARPHATRAKTGLEKTRASDVDDDDARRNAKPRDTNDEAPMASVESTDASDPQVLDGAFARGLVAAVLRASQKSEAADRLDGLATRARVSALLPEVRVRVARTISQGESLAPTEYDPTRVTATDGSTLWLEGRATFRLDRLVFADDEIQIERMRIERERHERALVDEVLKELAIWQKAEMATHDPEIVGHAAIDAEVALLAAEATLDVLSNGWFGAHRSALKRERVDASLAAKGSTTVRAEARQR